MGDVWSNTYTAQPIQVSNLANWDHLFDFPGDLTLTTTTPAFNNDYPQRSPVSRPLCGISSPGSQVSPVLSENTLSPLFASSLLSGPSTPSSTHNGTFSSPAPNAGLLLDSVDYQAQNDAQEAKVFSLSIFLSSVC